MVRTRLLALVPCLLLLAVTAKAQLVNADFDSDLQGWAVLSNGSSASFWSAQDAFPWRRGSGSALVAGVSTPAGPQTFAYFYGEGSPVTPGATYVVGGIVSVDRTANGQTDARFGVNWFPSAAPCFGGSVIGTDWGPSIPEATRWTRSLTTTMAPPGANYGCMFLYASNGHATFAVHLDKARFQEQP